MTLEQFLNERLGKISCYPDNLFCGQCLSVVKLYIKECFGINPPPSGTNSAYGYWSNFPDPLGTVFEKIENTPDLIPEKGWIAVWKPWASNQYGHIAIVAEGCTKGTLKNNAQNWSSKVFQLESNRYTNVVGFLKPKVYNKPEELPAMTEEEKRIIQFLKEKEKYTEGDVREMYGAWQDIVKVKELLKSSESLRKSLEESNKGLEAINLQKTEKVALLAKQLDTANKTLVKKDEEIGNLETQKNQYRKWYEKALESDYSKLDFWEILKLLFTKPIWNSEKK